jgi:protein transport protein SEC23
MIGLITYGKMVNVHELGFADCPKSFCFRGDKEYSSKNVHELLGLPISSDPLHKSDNSSLKRFLVPANECEFVLNSIIDDLQSDPWPVE